MVEDDRVSMKTFSSSSHVLRDLRVSCLSPPPSPSFSFPCMHRAPSATDNPQLWLSWLWGQKHSDGDSTRKQLQSVLQERTSKLYFQKGERKDTEAKEKLYKLPRGEQNRYQAQTKPRPQTEKKGRTNLPWAERKAVQKAFRSPPLIEGGPKHCPSRRALTDPTVNEHCYQAPGTLCLFRNKAKDPGFT